MTQEILLRQLEREKAARRETEHILERLALENYNLQKRLHINLDANSTLLEQYKSIVDKSSIVSKADKNGIITYANQEFCTISGYSLDELIGKPHSIVRHEEEPKSVFKDMWKTLKAQKIWKGIVKNRAKDGSTYYVKATIAPILDVNGETIEYIGMRENITEIIILQEELMNTQQELLEKLGEVAESRSKETGDHVKRVAEYSALMARLYGLDNEQIQHLKMASPMHDVGKIAIPDAILNKPGKLNKEEFEIMKTHAYEGFKVFQGSDKPLIRAAAIIAYEHHERWDGKGYPNGLQGEEIHIYGRITALADVFDALGSVRCYKQAWELDDILKLVQEESAKQFDPDLVQILLDNLDDFLSIRNSFIYDKTVRK